MYEDVLVATDLSEASDLTLKVVPELRALGLERVTLVHAQSVPYTYSVSRMNDFSSSRRVAERALQQQTEALQEQGRYYDFEVSSRLLSGSENEAQQLVNHVNEADPDLLVVGTRGASLATEFFLGGVTSRLLQNLSMPLFLVRIDVEDGEPELAAPAGDLLNHVLFPTDFSDLSLNVLNQVGDWNLDRLDDQGLLETFELLHVQEPLKSDERTDEDIRQRLEELKETLPDRLRSKTIVTPRRGSTVSQILTRCREQDVSLVAMSSQGRGVVSEVVLGSVSFQVARQASSHVLLIPGDES